MKCPALNLAQVLGFSNVFPMSKLLELESLSVYFKTDDGIAKAVDGVSYSLDKNETLGLVGESGCGKSVSALSIMRLVPSPPSFVAGGAIRFKGENLLSLSEAQMRSIRGNRIAMIFQEPMTSLNPVFTCGEQIAEAVRLHQKLSPKAAHERAIELLKLVGIPAPAQRAKEYPHQLSGGMRQRVMIAMALSCNPELLIADEPTTALDVTVQAQILELIASLQEQFGMGVLMITHDLGVIAEVSDRVAVMYASNIVESGTVEQIFDNPLHPYTQGLFSAIPRLGKKSERLRVIEGTVPPATDYPKGCHFAPRCSFATAQCHQEKPPLLEYEPQHFSACWHTEAQHAS